MSSHIGLYYPVIGFENDAWVKLSALYWDKLGRILPRGHDVHDSDTVRQLMDELDFIKSFAPSDEEIEAVSKMFLVMLNHGILGFPRHLSPIAEGQGTLLTAEYTPASNKRFYENLKDNEELDPKLSYILAKGKMSPALTEALYDTGLAVSVKATRKDGKEIVFVGMHPKLAFVYMEVLAEQMAINRQLYPVTDNVLDHVAVSGYSLERLTQALVGSGNHKLPISDSSLFTSYSCAART